MNFAMLLHLIRKDVRSRWSDVAALWIMLVLYAVVPLIAPQADYPYSEGPVTLWLFVTSIFLTLCILGLLASLLTDFIQTDHPRATDAFLHTRPVDRWSFALSKYLAWILVGVLPALAAVMTRLVVMRLDLRLSDYIKVALKDALLLAGIYGIVAVIAAILPKRRFALAIAVVMILVFSALVQVMNIPIGNIIYGQEPQSTKGSVHLSMNIPVGEIIHGATFRASVMEKSRQLAAWCLLAAGYHVLVGGLLARARWKSTLLLSAVPVLLWGVARFFWPVDLIWREGLPVVEDASRLAQLQKKVTLDAAGGLHSGYFSLIPSVGLQIAWGDGLEFPELAGYEARVLFPDGREWRSSGGPGGLEHLSFFSSLFGRKFQPGLLPVLPAPGMRVPGLLHDPAAPTPAVIQAVLTFPADKDVSLHGTAHLTSQVTLQWFRPVVLAALPLKAGSSFAHDGHRVRILEAGYQGTILSMHFCVEHSRSLMHFTQEFDADPGLTLFVVNPVRGQFALLHDRYTPPRSFYSTILGVESVDVAVSYSVPLAKAPLNITDQWLHEARLYVLVKQPIGQTSQSFDGDINVDVDPSGREDELRSVPARAQNAIPKVANPPHKP